MHTSRVFLFTLLAFVVGVGVRSFWEIGIEGIIAFSLAGGFLFVYWFFNRNYQLLGVIGITCIAFAFGIARFSWHASAVHEATILQYMFDNNIIVQGVVTEEPDQREKNTRLTLQVTNVITDANVHTANGRVLVFANRYPIYAYGDELVITGILRKPESFSDFDYPAFLAKDQIYALMYYPDITYISSDNGTAIKAILFRIKQAFENSLSRVFVEPHAAFLKGILLGSRASLPDWLLDAFRVTGVLHIIALSGFNITIIAVTIAQFFRWLTLSPQSIFWSSFFIITGFTIMVGASPSIVRASLMGILVLFAMKEGRQYKGAHALVFAGAVMIVHNPTVLRFDIAFQLSFLATTGLLFLAPRMEKYIMFLPNIFGIRSMLISTLAAQIAVLPLILFYFGEISLVSPITNLLILSLMPATMLFGFVSTVIGLIWVPAGIVIASIAYMLVNYHIAVVSFFATIPGASWYIGVPF